jgi:hypothetical protein
MAVKSLKRSTIESPAQNDNFASAGYSFQDFHHLETIQLSSNASSVSFINLDKYAGEYRHLQLRSVARMTYGDAERSLNIRLNSDSGANYYNHGLYGQNTTVGSFGFSQTEGFIGSYSAGNAASGAYGAGITDILDAFSSTKNKVIKSLAGAATTPQVSIRSVLWSNTSPITSITLLETTSVLVSGSRFSLYGIK